MRIELVPCLKDNYAYLVGMNASDECVVVDPSDAGPVLRALSEHALRPVAILNTHHHFDHVGGNSALVAKYSGLDVFGHESDRGRIPNQTRFVRDGEHFRVAGLEFEVMHIPGHTLGAIAYVTAGAVFTGDTLFAAGCGRLFEGTPADMYASLNQKLARLPDETEVYCGHEYTADNLRFAAKLEPSNQAIASKAARVAALRGRGEPTIPTTIAEERATNPFMRTDSAELMRQLGLKAGTDPVSVLARARRAKDDF